MNQPYISIIIPLYNKCKTIKDTLKSVLTQNYENFEVIVVDDGSTDGSAEVIKEINDIRVKLFPQKNAGPSGARNKGVELSEGEWILFLDADDTLLSGALMTFVNLINEFNDVDCIACNFYELYNKKKKIFSRFYRHRLISNNFKAWSLFMLFPRTGSAIFKREILMKNKFNENYRRFEDADHLFNIFHLGKFATDPTPVLVYNEDEASASKPLENPDKDFIFHIDFFDKCLWHQIALYPLYLQSKHIYGRAEYNNLIIPFKVKLLFVICKIFARFRN